MRIDYTSDTHMGFSDKTYRKQERYVKEWVSKHGLPDLFVVAGDIASHRPLDQQKSLFRILRQALGDTPIGVVRGNHDFWGYRRIQPNLNQLNESYAKACADFGITDLEQNTLEIGGVNIGGWLSWWQHGEGVDRDRVSSNVMTSEIRAMERDTFRALFDKIVETNGKWVLVTHMPPGHPYGSSEQPLLSLRGLIDEPIYITGHTHKPRSERLSGGELILNSGPDYDKPSIRTVEVLLEPNAQGSF